MHRSAEHRGRFSDCLADGVRTHPLVQGSPIQTINAGRGQLEIRLNTGHLLIFDSEANGYSLWPFPPEAVRATTLSVAGQSISIECCCGWGAVVRSCRLEYELLIHVGHHATSEGLRCATHA